MSSTGARPAGASTTTDGARTARNGGTDRDRDAHRDRDAKRGLTPAQLYCLLGGLALLLAGIFGFLADATFDTGGTIDPEGGNANGTLQGDSFLGFEVNGWHNLVHIASGLVLLAAFRNWRLAKTVAIAFGVVYALVALIGLIDGNDVFGIIPINGADNVLHVLLSLLGIISGVISRPKGDDDHR